MSSMFDGLYIARSGVNSSRAALNVTGQNITNANTPGYTRQRVDQSSIPPAEGDSLWAALGAAVGGGANVDSIEQLRDAFLDYEYRTQYGKSGESSTEVNTLNGLQPIFTNTTTASSPSQSSVIDVLSNEFSNFVSQLQNLGSSSSSISEKSVRDEAIALTQKLNTAAQALETARNEQYTDLKGKGGIDTVNTLLKNIASLSKQIKDAQTSGSSVLELQDQRNYKLDQLSKYIGIRVVETPTTLATGKTVDNMSVYLADQNGNPLTYKDASGATQKYTLLDNDSYAQFRVTPANSIHSDDRVKLSLSTASKDGSVNGFQYDASNVTATNTAVSGYLHTIATSTDPDVRENAFENLKSVLSCGSGSSLTLTDNGSTVTVKLAVSGGGTYNLVNGAVGTAAVGSAAQAGNTLNITDAAGGPVVPLTASDATLAGDVNSSIESGSLSGYLHLLNDKGDYDGSSFRGIGFYSDYLDTLAQTLASTLNGLNYDSAKKDSLGHAVPAEQQILFAGSTETPVAGHTGTAALNDITAAITAKNIHVAVAWKDGVLTKTKDVSPSNDSNGASQSNIEVMVAQLRNTSIALNTKLDHTGSTIYTGTLSSAFANAGSMLAQGTNSVQSTDDTNSSKLNTIDVSRQAISSVSLDDEAIGIVQYTQTLNASSRFMTAVDECLQTIINNMGLVGR